MFTCKLVESSVRILLKGFLQRRAYVTRFCKGQTKAVCFGEEGAPVLMKVSASLTIRDKKTDKLVWRKGRLYRINKSKPRNKGRQG